MLEPLQSELGLLGATEAAKAILAGAYICPPGTDAYNQEFVSAMKASTQYNPGVPTTVKGKDFTQYWKKAKERTSSSYSGLHFGHYITWAQNELLAELHALEAEIIRTLGYSLECWQAGLSAMLDKKVGVFRVKRLCA